MSPGSFPCWSGWAVSVLQVFHTWADEEHWGQGGLLLTPHLIMLTVGCYLSFHIRCMEFSFLALPVQVLGSSTCTDNKEMWKRSIWGCLVEKKIINLPEEKMWSFSTILFNSNAYRHSILISFKPHMYGGCCWYFCWIIWDVSVILHKWVSQCNCI